MDLAGRAVHAAVEADTAVTIVTPDPDVRRWAETLDAAWIGEPAPGGLNAAAAAGVTTADGAPWLVIHADLPAITPTDVAVGAALAAAGTVLAPSHDGGTSLVGGVAPSFPFAYGPGSFFRHLTATAGHATILVRPGLALDLDAPRDLDAFETLGLIDR
jgi:2-phospho-L-lactate guanylyltransferase